MNTQPRHEHDKASEWLQRDIEARREHLATLVAALSDRLSPSHLMEQAMDAGKEHGGEFARNLGHSVKANPVPALITAAGMAWLYAAKDRDPEAHPPSSDGDDESLRERASDGLHAARQHGHDARRALSARAHQAGDTFRHWLDDSPLAVGAVAVAAGALLGLAIPESRKEDELLGEARETLGERAHALGERAATQAQRSDRASTADRPSASDGAFTG